jgi:hypothetical protein
VGYAEETQVPDPVQISVTSGSACRNCWRRLDPVRSRGLAAKGARWQEMLRLACADLRTRFAGLGPVNAVSGGDLKKLRGFSTHSAEPAFGGLFKRLNICVAGC